MRLFGWLRGKVDNLRWRIVRLLAGRNGVLINMKLDNAPLAFAEDRHLVSIGIVIRSTPDRAPWVTPMTVAEQKELADGWRTNPNNLPPPPFRSELP